MMTDMEALINEDINKGWSIARKITKVVSGVSEYQVMLAMCMLVATFATDENDARERAEWMAEGIRALYATRVDNEKSSLH